MLGKIYFCIVLFCFAIYCLYKAPKWLGMKDQKMYHKFLIFVGITTTIMLFASVFVLIKLKPEILRNESATNLKLPMYNEYNNTNVFDINVSEFKDLYANTDVYYDNLSSD